MQTLCLRDILWNRLLWSDVSDENEARRRRRTGDDESRDPVSALLTYVSGYLPLLTRAHVHTCTRCFNWYLSWWTWVMSLGFPSSFIPGPFPSVLWHCWLGDRKGIRPLKYWVLVYWWWHFDWSFARFIAPVVTITSVTLSSNKIQNGDILVPANPGPPWKWPLKWRDLFLDHASSWDRPRLFISSLTWSHQNFPSTYIQIFRNLNVQLIPCSFVNCPLLVV